MPSVDWGDTSVPEKNISQVDPSRVNEIGLAEWFNDDCANIQLQVIVVECLSVLFFSNGWSREMMWLLPETMTKFRLA